MAAPAMTRPEDAPRPAAAFSSGMSEAEGWALAWLAEGLVAGVLVAAGGVEPEGAEPEGAEPEGVCWAGLPARGAVLWPSIWSWISLLKTPVMPDIVYLAEKAKAGN